MTLTTKGCGGIGNRDEGSGLYYRTFTTKHAEIHNLQKLLIYGKYTASSLQNLLKLWFSNCSPQTSRGAQNYLKVLVIFDEELRKSAFNVKLFLKNDALSI
ncbi:hypothetical protein NPIL_305951 [Nephila pilipes]|uniref:Uncharacterized protein n=1 Tax=Nephila pilipes TaxID=299642 RepID=A0A8X6N2A5_NEPPI|nr:hypothetical protein NPIL_305951 [Nephila pilipes]